MVVSIPNFRKVHPFLCRSAQPDKDGYLALKQEGVSTIIDLRMGFEQSLRAKQVEDIGLDYMHMPMGLSDPGDDFIAKIFERIDQAKLEPDKGSVLIHCVYGRDRTGTILALWRVSRDDWSFEEAYAEMCSFGFLTQLSGLTDTVKRYAKN